MWDKNHSGSITLAVAVTVAAITVIGLAAKNTLAPQPEKTSSGPVVPTQTLTLTTVVPTPTPTDVITPTPTIVPTNTPKPTITPSPTSKPLTGPPGAGLTSSIVATEVGNFKATIMSFDTTTVKMVTDSAQDNDCANECTVIPLKDFITRNNGFAGVNGTYFCPDTYPDCASKKNSFDFPIYNSRLNKWMQGDKLGWSNRRAILYQDGGGIHYQHNSAGFGGGLNAGIINYPGLVDGGNVQIDEGQSGLSDKQRAKGTKMGIGTRGPGNVMVVMASNVDMREFAYVFKTLGATGALNLDTGGSTALMFNGKYIAGPGRNLPNAVIFVRK